MPKLSKRDFAKLLAGEATPREVKSKAKVSKAKFVELSRIPLGERLLGLDVSSHATGAAIVLATNRGPVVESWCLSTPTEGWEAMRRVAFMTIELADWYKRQSPVNRAVIEWCDGKPRGPRSPMSLNVLAKAQGAIWQLVREWGIDPIETVKDSEWTLGVSKEKRASHIRALVPEYAAWHKNDKGLDIADAIGLCFYRIGLGNN